MTHPDHVNDSRPATKGYVREHLHDIDNRIRDLARDIHQLQLTIGTTGMGMVADALAIDLAREAKLPDPLAATIGGLLERVNILEGKTRDMAYVPNTWKPVFENETGRPLSLGEEFARNIAFRRDVDSAKALATFRSARGPIPAEPTISLVDVEALAVKIESASREAYAYRPLDRYEAKSLILDAIREVGREALQGAIQRNAADEFGYVYSTRDAADAAIAEIARQMQNKAETGSTEGRAALPDVSVAPQRNADRDGVQVSAPESQPAVGIKPGPVSAPSQPIERDTFDDHTGDALPYAIKSPHPAPSSPRAPERVGVTDAMRELARKSSMIRGPDDEPNHSGFMQFFAIAAADVAAELRQLDSGTHVLIAKEELERLRKVDITYKEWLVTGEAEAVFERVATQRNEARSERDALRARLDAAEKVSDEEVASAMRWTFSGNRSGIPLEHVEPSVRRLWIQSARAARSLLLPQTPSRAEGGA